MSEEKKPEIEEGLEETQECSGGYRWHHRCGEVRPWGHHRGHWMRKHVMMRFVSMSVEEEVELLESVKARLEDRLRVVDERLVKLKA
jgi:hypothetical protein